MKKKLALVLAVLLLLSACAPKDDPEPSTTDTQAPTTEAPATEEPTEPPTEGEEAAWYAQEAATPLPYEDLTTKDLPYSGGKWLIAQNGKAWVYHLYNNAGVLEVTDEGGWDGPAHTIALPEELAAHDAVYCCFQLRPPANLDHADVVFFWLLEYEKEIPAYVPNTFKLLAASASEALYYQRFCKSRLREVKRHVKKRWVWGALLLLLTGAMFIRVPESATAEFTLKAPEITAAYAWFDGPIAACPVQDGEIVKKGDVIAEYDTDQLLYRLSSAQNALREIEAELALEQQNAFTDEERLGKVKLLEARRDTMQVAVREAQWYLEHARIMAPADGILALADGRAEQLAGKAVRTGDKLFEVFGGSGMVAEIPVNERDASVLRREFRATLFLHTAPEDAIPAEILEISHYPELTEQKTYCYKVRVRLPEDSAGLRYGMRGVARLSGGNVSLGYRLFKSVVLYFRGL